MTVAVTERKLRIDVGYGLERAIPDARAALVIEQMVSQFRQAQYAVAIDAGFEALIAAAAVSPATLGLECEPGR